jgi:hypothetical protein
MIRHHFDNDLQQIVQQSLPKCEDKAINTEPNEECNKELELNQPAIHTHTLQLRNQIEVLHRKLNSMHQNVHLADRLLTEDRQTRTAVLVKPSSMEQELVEQMQELRTQMSEIMNKLSLIEMNYERATVNKRRDIDRSGHDEIPLKVTQKDHVSNTISLGQGRTKTKSDQTIKNGKVRPQLNDDESKR